MLRWTTRERRDLAEAEAELERWAFPREVAQKHCEGCGEKRPANTFERRGGHSRCRVCRIADDRIRREAIRADLDHWEGRRRAIQDRYEREYERFGPSPEERVNQGQGRYE